MKDDIMVSICCLAYNHEKYIRQCLDSLLMQKCDFRFEILVNDDASKDRTPEIIKEYELRFPEIVKPIYQKENQFSVLGCNYINNVINVPRARGKYIACCEGDDFWTDPYKLQKQYESLEKNRNCFMCIHSVESVTEDGKPLNVYYPKKEYKLSTGVLSSERFLSIESSENNSFQTTSHFMRAEYLKQFAQNVPKFSDVASTGDLPLLLYFAQLGDVYYINEVMSCYRRGSTASIERGKAFSGSESSVLKHYSHQFDCLNEYDKYTNYKFHKYCVRKENALRFNLAWNYSNYKEMIKPRYRYFMNRFPIKARIKIYLSAFFPGLIKRYDNKE